MNKYFKIRTKGKKGTEKRGIVKSQILAYISDNPGKTQDEIVDYIKEWSEKNLQIPIKQGSGIRKHIRELKTYTKEIKKPAIDKEGEEIKDKHGKKTFTIDSKEEGLGLLKEENHNYYLSCNNYKSFIELLNYFKKNDTMMVFLRTHYFFSKNVQEYVRKLFKDRLGISFPSHDIKFKFIGKHDLIKHSRQGLYLAFISKNPLFINYLLGDSRKHEDIMKVFRKSLLHYNKNLSDYELNLFKFNLLYFCFGIVAYLKDYEINLDNMLYVLVSFSKEIYRPYIKKGLTRVKSNNQPKKS